MTLPPIAKFVLQQVACWSTQWRSSSLLSVTKRL